MRNIAISRDLSLFIFIKVYVGAKIINVFGTSKFVA
jgi:hypothetical protein